MEYTPGQLRDLAGLSKEAYRHWKRVLPSLATGKKHAPCFSAGDVLATTVLCRVTESCGARIGQLTGVASRIFDICNRTPWEVLANRILVLNLSVNRCMIVAESKDIPRRRRRRHLFARITDHGVAEPSAAIRSVFRSRAADLDCRPTKP